jgi:hypothetical protein
MSRPAKLAQNLRLTVVGPAFFSYADAIVGHMKTLGISVQGIDERDSASFFVKSIFRLAWLRYLFGGVVKKRHEAITRKVHEFNSTHVLFISPESVNESLIKSLRTMGVKVSLYMWDSFDNKPAARHCLLDFDNAASFDPLDAETHQIPLINLFAEDEFFSKKSGHYLRKIDLSFVGTAHSSRPQVITSLVTNPRFAALSKKIHLYRGNAYYYFRARLVTWFSVNTPLSNQSISKLEVAEIFNNSKYILDVTHVDQRGLTSRSFEALAAGGILVTNNRWSKEVLPSFSARIIIFDDIDSLDVDELEWSESIDSDLSYLTLQRFCNDILRLIQQ